MKRTEHKTQRKRTFVLPDYTRKLSRQSKNRFTTALCSNNTGAFIVPLLVIRKSKRPKKAFPKIFMKSERFIGKSARMTTEICNRWLKHSSN
ncbi:hypothetical protein T4B_9345 [Trichinella pseudospiralis]|uniref:DDE-1 domain-containing protein n=1 Tax=Trichinella pseudospiralis TaxID=6337 RepID=A0A0V1IA32_TRIPS|nr:hypothetical protein T4B_9345 [Trichinella pseudospiralis]